MKKVVTFVFVIILSATILGCSDEKSITDSQTQPQIEQEYDKTKEDIAEIAIESDNVDDKSVDIDNDLKEMNPASSENSGSFNLEKGQIIEFGCYNAYNENSNKNESIEWIVLDVNEEKGAALLLSKYCLAQRAYEQYPDNKEFRDVTWETCTLRKWLNGEFYDEAFSASEKEKILLTLNKNSDNIDYGTPGGNDTNDRVFLLSYSDMINSEYGFSTEPNSKDINRRSTLVKRKGEKSDAASSWITEDGEYACWWWLRSPGYNTECSLFVGATGVLSLSSMGSSVYSNSYGYDIGDDNGAGVRPALWISIKS